LWLLSSLALAVLLASIIANRIAHRSPADLIFEMELAALVHGEEGTRPALQEGRFRKDDQFSLQLRPDNDVHVYLLEEDSKGRKYLVFPKAGGKGNPLEAGKLHRLPPANSLRAGGYPSSVEGGPRSWILIACIEPLGPLEDAVPLEGASSKTGKEGHPRLKPVTVRGLQRRIQEILGREQAAPNDDEDADDSKRLSDEIEDAVAKEGAPVRGRGIWLGKFAFKG